MTTAPEASISRQRIRLAPRPPPAPRCAPSSDSRSASCCALAQRPGWTRGSWTAPTSGSNPPSSPCPFVVLYGTLAWVVQRLSPAVQAQPVLRFTLTASWCSPPGPRWPTSPAAPGRACTPTSPLASPLESMLYSLMGVGALSLVVGIAIVGWLVGQGHRGAAGPGAARGRVVGFWAVGGADPDHRGLPCRATAVILWAFPAAARRCCRAWAGRGWVIAAGPFLRSCLRCCPWPLYAMQAVPVVGLGLRWTLPVAWRCRLPGSALTFLGGPCITLGTLSGVRAGFAGPAAGSALIGAALPTFLASPGARRPIPAVKG